MTFKKYKFSENQIKRYFNAAKKDFSASIKLKNHDIQFRIAYDALLKMSIAVCANEGLMVDSKRGHHKELIEELSKILKRKDIRSIGNEVYPVK